MGNIKYIHLSLKIKDMEAFTKSNVLDVWENLDIDVYKDGRMLIDGDEQDHIDTDDLADDLAKFASKDDWLMVQDIEMPASYKYIFDGDDGYSKKEL